MKISANWLSDFVDVDVAPEELADRLTLVGLEVDDVEFLGGSFDGVVVGRVQSVSPHPNADRLVVCSVDLGGDAPDQIVCGAPNVAAGQLVPVATVGSTLRLPDRDVPDSRVPVKIRKAKIRGVASRGMICAEDELGLSDDHSGIMVLEDTAVPGQAFGTYLNEHGFLYSDAVIDIEVTPNRSDANSHIGVAREVAAMFDKELTLPPTDVPTESGQAAEQVSVVIEAPELCSRYAGILVRDVQIGPSPDWMQHRLEAVGIRPRNNVVDITNYVMYETGQPLHGFDFDLLADSTIIVRTLGESEPFTTLDGVERQLEPETLMICDGERPVAIAGVMGGGNSEVSDDTRNVLIESAWFEPRSIRRTARRLQLQTDASYRFERGVDPRGCVRAAARAAALMAEITGGTIVPGVVDAHPRPFEPRSAVLRPERVRAILGVDIPENVCASLLSSIGFDRIGDDQPPRFQVPSFRPDVEREIDLIEEVARLYGYDRITTSQGNRIPYARPAEPPETRMRSEALRFLSGCGFREAYTNSLQSKSVAQVFEAHLLPVIGDAQLVESQNPISRDMAVLRPSLLPGMLPVVGRNFNHGQESIRVMELGRVFHRTGKRDAGVLVEGYREREMLLLAMSGRYAPRHWSRPERQVDLYDIKGAVENLLTFLKVDDAAFEAMPGGEVLLNRLAIRLQDDVIGLVGQVEPRICSRFEVDLPVFAAELDWQHLSLKSAYAGSITFSPVSRYPTVVRDLAIVLRDHVPAADVERTIRNAAGPLLRQIEVFDVYTGSGLEARQKSLAVSLRFGADRTLVDAEVDEAVQGIVATLEQQLDASLRG